MKILKALAGILFLLVLLPAGMLGYLYISNPVLASRYTGLFTSADDDYSLLTPRMYVKGNSPRVIPVATVDELTIDPAAFDEMIAYAQKHKSYSLIVIHKGVIQKEWYEDGWDRSRAAQSQSMHKSLLPVLTQALIEEGRIGSLQDPIRLYIPEWADDARGDITLEQMLQMSSGLHSPPFSLNPYSDDYQWLFGTDVTPILLSMQLEWEPGSQWEYNNVVSEIMGLVIERAAGQPYADILSEKLWTPIGAEDAEVWLDKEGGKAKSNCCLLSPPMNWAKFGLMLLNRGEVNGNQLVAAEFIDQMTSPAPSSDWYGLQIWLTDSNDSNPWLGLTRGYQKAEGFLREDTYYASGFGAQRVYVVPSEELVIVRMGPATGEDLGSPVRADWDNAYLVNTAVRNLK